MGGEGKRWDINRKYNHLQEAKSADLTSSNYLDIPGWSTIVFYLNPNSGKD